MSNYYFKDRTTGEELIIEASNIVEARIKAVSHLLEDGEGTWSVVSDALEIDVIDLDSLSKL